MSIARPISRGISRPISRGIVRGDAIDPDAAAVIAALEASGATVSGEQAAAIDEFHRTGKSQGWYDALKRFYLPIWGIAASNAIDWIERGSGTFVGDMVHSAGFVNSEAGSGHFDSLTNPSDIDQTPSNAYLFALALDSYGNNARVPAVFRTSDSSNARLGSLTSGLTLASLGNKSVTSGTPESIYSVSGLFENVSAYKRTSSGRSLLGQNTTSGNLSTLPEGTYPFPGLRTNEASTVTLRGTFRLGAYGLGLGMSDAHDAAFTSALKTLWETCTGLSLP